MISAQHSIFFRSKGSVSRRVIVGVCIAAVALGIASYLYIGWTQRLTVDDVRRALESVPNDPDLDRRIIRQGDKAVPLIFEVFDQQCAMKRGMSGVVFYNTVRLVRHMRGQKNFHKSPALIAEILTDRKAHPAKRRAAAWMSYWLWNDPKIQDAIKRLIQEGEKHNESPYLMDDAAIVAYARGYPNLKSILGVDYGILMSRAEARARFDGNSRVKVIFELLRKQPQMGEIVFLSEMSNLIGSVDPAKPYFRSVLADRKEPDRVRLAAVEALGWGYGLYKVVQTALIRAAEDDPSPEVRAAAVATLAGGRRSVGGFHFVPPPKDRMADSEKAILHAFESDPSAKVRASSLAALQSLLDDDEFTQARPDARERFAAIAEAALERKGESAEVKRAARELLDEARKKQ